MDEAEMRERVASARVARLATVRADLTPHIVPVCFAFDGARTIVSIVDAKPKRNARLQRLDNMRANPAVSLLVDHYEDDWTRLWWVRVDGNAAVLTEGEEHSGAVAALAAKYEQYRDDPPTGAVLRIIVERWVGWGWTG